MRNGVLLALIVVIVLAFTPGEPLQAQSGGQIVFSSERDGDQEIYLMNADGSNLRQLTRNTDSDDYPSWSPDGRYIAFISNRDGNYALYVMDTDGGNQRRVANYVISHGAPSWSPDGQKIAIGSDRDGDREVYLVDANGSNYLQLTDNTSDDYSPAFSPDGSMIVFTTDRDDDWEIYVMKADGSNPVNVSRYSGASEFAPAWTPDGRVSFESFRDGDYGEIYLTQADGSGTPVNITNHPQGSDWVHGWAPSGKYVAFQSFRNEDWDIYMMSVGGGDPIQLTDSPGDDGRPMWKPLNETGLTNALDRETTNEARVAATLVQGREPLALGDLLVDERFDAGSSWGDHVGETSSATLEDGSYHMEISTDDWTYWIYNPMVEEDTRGLVMEVDATHTGSNENLASLMCRAGADKGYFFDVSSIGEYGIREFVDGSMYFVIDWTPAPVINTGTATNHITVVCYDSYLALYVNHQLLAESYDVTFSTGVLGLSAATSARSDSADITFDNLVVWEVEETGPAIAECWVTAESLVNVRIGPGMSYADIRQLDDGDSLLANGQFTDEEEYVWWRFADHSWIRSDVVSADTACNQLPEVSR